MLNTFYALLGRMKYIDRWCLMRSSRPENLCEHTLETAYIAHALVLLNRQRGGRLEPEKAVLYALYHDCTEILTGDMPTPVKYKNESIKTAYKAVEKEAQSALLSRLPVPMAEEMAPWFTPTEEYRPFIKAADKISALIKCTEERRAGNHEFDRAYDTLLQAIHELALPEAEQFLLQHPVQGAGQRAAGKPSSGRFRRAAPAGPGAAGAPAAPTPLASRAAGQKKSSPAGELF